MSKSEYILLILNNEFRKSGLGIFILNLIIYLNYYSKTLLNKKTSKILNSKFNSFLWFLGRLTATEKVFLKNLIPYIGVLSRVRTIYDSLYHGENDEMDESVIYNNYNNYVFGYQKLKTKGVKKRKCSRPRDLVLVPGIFFTSKNYDSPLTQRLRTQVRTKVSLSASKDPWPEM